MKSHFFIAFVLLSQVAFAQKTVLYRQGKAILCEKAEDQKDCDVFRCGQPNLYYFPNERRLLEEPLGTNRNQAQVSACGASIEEAPQSRIHHIYCNNARDLETVGDEDLTQETFGTSKMFREAEACGLTGLPRLRLWGLNNLIDRKPNILSAFQTATTCEDPSLIETRKPTDLQDSRLRVAQSRGRLNGMLQTTGALGCFKQNVPESELKRESTEFFQAVIDLINASETPSRLQAINGNVTALLQNLSYNMLSPECAGVAPGTQLNADFIKNLIAVRRMLKEKLGYTNTECNLTVVDMTSDDETKKTRSKKGGSPKFARELRAAAVVDYPKNSVIEVHTPAEAISKLFAATESCDYKNLAFYGHGSEGNYFIHGEPLQPQAMAMIRDVHYNAEISFHACNVGKGDEGQCFVGEVSAMNLTRDKGYSRTTAPLDYLGHSSFMGMSTGTYVTRDGSNAILGDVLEPTRLQWVTVNRAGKKANVNKTGRKEENQ